MLDDSYAEFLVKRKTTTGKLVLKFLLIFAATFCAILGLLLSAFTYGVTMLVGIGVCAGVYFLIKSFNVEYEYVYAGGELTIDKITDQSKRKKIIDLDMQKVELVAEYKSHHMDNYRNNPALKVFDYSSGDEDAKVYAIAYTDAKNKGLYLFEPNEKLLKVMRGAAPRKIILGS